MKGEEIGLGLIIIIIRNWLYKFCYIYLINKAGFATILQNDHIFFFQKPNFETDPGEWSNATCHCIPSETWKIIVAIIYVDIKKSPFSI